MCGSFAFITQTTLLGQYFGMEDDWKEKPASRYNVRPGQQATIITRNSPNKAEQALWGFVGPWEKEWNSAHKVINARSESIFEKPMFKHAAQFQRCVVPCSLFYEWADTTQGKQPYAFKLKDQPVFGLAGLWQESKDAEEKPVKTFCIITTEPNEIVGKIHNRMPCMLTKDGQDKWLNPTTTEKDKLLPLLDPYPAEEMESYPVSKLVNSPANDSPRIIEPIELNR